MKRRLLKESLDRLNSAQKTLYNAGFQHCDFNLIKAANDLARFIADVEKQLDAQFARTFWLSCFAVAIALVFLVYEFT